MKIECRIKRVGGTRVSMPNSDGSETEYHFAPLDPTRADSPHVAEIDDRHVPMFFRADAEVYVPFGAAEAQVDALLTRPTSEQIAAQAVADAAAAEVAAQAQRDADAAVQAERDRLAAEEQANKEAGRDDDSTDTDAGELSVRGLREQIAAGQLNDEQLRELMAEEEGRPEPRATFIAEIVKALKK